MKEKIEEVQAYFKNKIIAGDYEVTKVEKDGVVLLIDGFYVYRIYFWSFVSNPSLWLINGFILVDFTKDEIISIAPKIQAIVADAEKANKMEQLENLKKELGL